ncbi:hypothetical protein GGH94_001272 [Coemansia aciculifera]|uniref:Uncharacterized protein n=1 Tax=Coemansia aciculifera TaxID=417176 RepID=A0A9W8M8A2_9FUNG|nr:hypothetical protein GGH94_001272 [Coemansia aciculifera]
MVRLNMRSFALMALAMVAAASPVLNAAKEAAAPAALSVPAAPAPVALVAPLADASHKQEVVAADAHSAQQLQPPASGNVAQNENIDVSKMGIWVPCSESECMRDMTPEQKEAFKRDCEKMQLSHKNDSVDGKSRVSSDTALNYFQMIIPEKDAARLALNNQPCTFSMKKPSETALPARTCAAAVAARAAATVAAARAAAAASAAAASVAAAAHAAATAAAAN